MNRSRASTVLFALAACVCMNGCTIYTYERPAHPPHPHHPVQQAPVQQAPVQTPTPATTTPVVAQPSNIGRPIFSKPRPTGTTDNSITNGGPVVKSATVFGGPTVAAFHGHAYVIPEGTTRMPNFADLVPFGQLYTDRFAVAPTTFSGGFPGALQQDEWFAIRYQGKVVTPGAARYTFKLTSDDGAILYIDGRKVIDNDGVHAAKTTTGEVDLTAGQHQLVLDYFQEKRGTVALQLWTVVGGQDIPVVGAL